MIVDNEIGILHRLKDIVKTKELDTIVAFYQNALTILDEGKPNIVLFNADVRKHIGLKFLNFVKINYPTLPIIIVVSVTGFLTKETMTRLGVTDCIYSPFNTRLLLVKIRHALKLETRDENRNF